MKQYTIPKYILFDSHSTRIAWHSLSPSKERTDSLANKIYKACLAGKKDNYGVYVHPSPTQRHTNLHKSHLRIHNNN